jgi:hypothetical protein
MQADEIAEALKKIEGKISILTFNLQFSNDLIRQNSKLQSNTVFGN